MNHTVECSLNKLQRSVGRSVGWSTSRRVYYRAAIQTLRKSWDKSAHSKICVESDPPYALMQLQSN
jgi:hypothetical protein